VKPDPKNKHEPWLYGKVVKNRGHRSCVVNTAVGLIQRNHKQLHKAEVTPQAFNNMKQEELEIISLPDETELEIISLPDETVPPLPTPPLIQTTEEQVTALPSPAVETQPAPLRRSTRIRKSPERFKDYIR
jgi:hypothetical protein